MLKSRREEVRRSMQLTPHGRLNLVPLPRRLMLKRNDSDGHPQVTAKLMRP